jgi:hypothetical protein
VSSVGFQSGANQSIQAGTVLILKEIVHCGGSVHVQKLGCLRRIQNAFVSLGAEPVFPVAAHG